MAIESWAFAEAIKDAADWVASWQSIRLAMVVTTLVDRLTMAKVVAQSNEQCRLIANETSQTLQSFLAGLHRTKLDFLIYIKIKVNLFIVYYLF
jgi:hypothetical protein